MKFFFVHLKKVWSANVESIDKWQRDDVRQTRRVSIRTALYVTADEREEVCINWVSIPQRRHQFIT